MKTCTVCSIEKEATLFRKGKICRACENIRARQYRKTKTYREVKARYRASEKGKATERRREQVPEVREKRRLFSASEQGQRNKKKYEATAKGKQTHKKALRKYLITEKGRTTTRLREKLRASQPERKAKQKLYHQRYYQSEKGKAAAAKRNARRYSWVMKTDHPLTAAQWLQVLKVNHYRCHYCKVKTKLTIDHVIPLSKGGQHVMENVVPACPSCNSKKHDKIVRLL